KDGATVVIVKNDKTASSSITVDSMDGASAKEIADAFVSELNGKNLQETEDGYQFEFDTNGVNSKCFLSTENGKYALIVVTGLENATDEILGMIDSLQEK
ncbi:MAG: hypothetical protein IJ597_06115, partial [Synergistaceae bacterium]|nr:hypothetical protein [Synergistaceae bacterium]